MFSAQQLEKFAGKKRITQQTFDEAVKENIDEFEMEAEEAVASAVAEFQSQDVDLSNIITTASGGDLSDHPLTKTIKDLEAAVDSADHTESQKALESLRIAALEASSTSFSSEVCRQFGAMASSLDAVTHIVNALKQGTSDNNTDTQISAAGALRALLPLSSDMKTRFLRADGIEALAVALSTQFPTTPNNPEIYSKIDAGTNDRKHQILTAALLQAVAASTIKAENNKCAAMEAELGSLTLQVLQHSSSSSRSSSSSDDSNRNAVVLAVCAVLSSLTTADDDSQPSSTAFANARLIAKKGAVEALVTSLRIYATTTSTSNSDTSKERKTSGNVSSTCTNRDVLIALCGALRQIAANDDICQEAASSGAVPLALELADRGLDTQDTDLLRAALNVLKQLASSDGIKAEIFEAGGLETLKNSLKLITDQVEDSNSGTIHISSVAVVEQALGLLTNVTLRNPEISMAAVSSGCVVEVLRAMHALLDTAPRTSGSFVGKKAESSLRQGCMALRNIAARCPEERQVLLAEGAEKLLREVKKVFPSSCQDVGSAALRDLGLDNYNK